MRADQLKALIALGLPTEVLQQVVDIVTKASPGALRQHNYRVRKASREHNVGDAHVMSLKHNDPVTSDAFGGTIGGEVLSLEVKKKERSLSRHVEPSRFPEFKAAYPKRSGSTGWAKAEKIFDRLVAKGIPPETLIDGAGAYAQQQEALEKAGTEFVKMAQTWLNQEGWKDVEAAEEQSHEARYNRAIAEFRSRH